MYSFTGNEYIEKAVENYSDAMLNAAYSILKSTADAEDVVQEAFLKYIRKKPVFNSDEHEKAWLITVATNQCKDTEVGYYRPSNMPPYCTGDHKAIQEQIYLENGVDRNAIANTETQEAA